MSFTIKLNSYTIAKSALEHIDALHETFEKKFKRKTGVSINLSASGPKKEPIYEIVLRFDEEFRQDAEFLAETYDKIKK